MALVTTFTMAAGLWHCRLIIWPDLNRLQLQGFIEGEGLTDQIRDQRIEWQPHGLQTWLAPMPNRDTLEALVTTIFQADIPVEVQVTEEDGTVLYYFKSQPQEWRIVLLLRSGSPVGSRQLLRLLPQIQAERRDKYHVSYYGEGRLPARTVLALLAFAGIG